VKDFLPIASMRCGLNLDAIIPQPFEGVRDAYGDPTLGNVPDR
jgi:hypothetical protein